MFSVVIPSLNAPLIGRVVAALQHQSATDLLCEIIVVGRDRDGLVPTTVQFHDTGRPVAAAIARNRGARAASGEYVLFIDSDCVADPDLLERLAERHRQGYPVVGGSIAAGNDDYWMRCDHTLIFADFLPEAPSGERGFLPSGCCSIRRDLFIGLGGFDERFPGAAGEEVDLSLRLRAMGHQLLFEPRARVDHCHPRSSAAIVWTHLRRFGQVQVTLWRRHPELARAPLGGRIRPFAGLLTACAPLLALADTTRLYARSPGLLPQIALLPGVAWARTAWYWGVAEALLATP